MKILHCITGLTQDGAQNMLLRLTRGLIANGFTNTVVSLSKREPFAERFEELGIRVHYLDMRRGIPDPRAMLRLRSIVRTEEPDLLQGWMYHGNVALTLGRLGARNRSPLVWNIRRGLDDINELRASTRVLITANAKLSSWTERIIYCTDRSAEQHEQHGFAVGKGVVIGNGFNIDRFRPRPDSRPGLLKALNLPRDAIVIGNVGRFDVAKGHSDLIESFARVAEVFPTAHLVMVGRGIDSSNKELTGLLSRHGVSSRVHLLGERSSIEEIYPLFDLYCSSSIAEGFPNVVAEAMASGVPCVVTDTGASRKLAEGVGIVAPPRSTELLGAALFRMLAKPGSERREMGMRSRERIVAHYSLANVIATYSRLYQTYQTTVSGSMRHAA